MKRLSFAKLACIGVLFCGTAEITSHAQTLTTILSFDGSNGSDPVTLVQGLNGNFYGTTSTGGIGCQSQYGAGCGTVFEITPKGLNTIYKFCSQANCADGVQPNQLFLSPTGHFYGTTFAGGSYSGLCGALEPGCGTMFEIAPDGKFTTLYTFLCQSKCADGTNPQAPPVLGINGNLYGTTLLGGANSSACPYGCGTIFEITPTGTLTTLHEFCTTESCSDGSQPRGLTLAANGDFYGASINNKETYGGTFFRISADGNYKNLYQFCEHTNCLDGAFPSSVVQGTDGNFYGTTLMGGSGNGGSGAGTFFRITPRGELTTLYNFCSQTNCTDGWDPSPVILGTDGNFYGTTGQGGAYQNPSCSPSNGCGTIFKITPTGKLTTLYSFCAETNCPDGARPGALVQGTDGKLYGGTSSGGGSSNCFEGCGTLFRLSVGLKPFIESVPNFSKVGMVIGILGNGLTGTTSVTFNGTPAKFTVVSSTEIRTTVPKGASTGFVEVTTPKKMLKSNVVFRVIE